MPGRRSSALNEFHRVLLQCKALFLQLGSCRIQQLWRLVLLMIGYPVVWTTAVFSFFLLFFFVMYHFRLKTLEKPADRPRSQGRGNCVHGRDAAVIGYRSM